MNIRLDPHTLQRAEERGTTQGELQDVFRTGKSEPAKYGRKAKSKVYSYENERNGIFYKQKRVKLVYTDSDDEIVAVTAYVYYGEWMEE